MNEVGGAAFKKVAGTNSLGGNYDLSAPETMTTIAMRKILDVFVDQAQFFSDQYRESGLRGIDVDVGFTMSFSFNAFCAEVDERVAIGLTAGVFLQLRWFFSQMFLIKLFEELPWFEKWPAWEARRAATEYQAVDELTDNTVFNLLTDRQKLTVELYVQRACLFLLHHEFGHAWNGHRQIKAGGIHRASASAEQSLESYDDLSFVMEVDADVRAARAIYILHSPDCLVGGSAAVKSSTTLAGLETEHEIFNIVFAVYVAFRYIRSYHATNFIGLSESHPPVVSRTFWFLQRLRLEYCEYGNFDIRDFEDVILGAVMLAENVYVAVTGHQHLNIFDEKLTHMANSILVLLDQVWKRARPMLLPHVHGRDLNYHIVNGSPLLVDRSRCVDVLSRLKAAYVIREAIYNVEVVIRRCSRSVPESIKPEIDVSSEGALSLGAQVKKVKCVWGARVGRMTGLRSHDEHFARFYELCRSLNLAVTKLGKLGVRAGINEQYNSYRYTQSLMESSIAYASAFGRAEELDSYNRFRLLTRFIPPDGAAEPSLSNARSFSRLFDREPREHLGSLPITELADCPTTLRDPQVCTKAVDAFITSWVSDLDAALCAPERAL